jgi:hypothetical protein
MADDKKELDPIKVLIFIGVLVFLGVFFTADDLTGLGEILDPIEFILTLIIGAGFGGKIGFWKKTESTKPEQRDGIPAIEYRSKNIEKKNEDGGKKDIVVKATDVTDHDRLRRCPFCGEKLKFKKEPKFCPYCEESLVNKAS